MKNRKSVEANLTMPPDQEPTQALIAKLSPEGRRRYVDLILAREFSPFVTKVFETVSPGDVYLPNWHIDAMTYAAGRVMDGTIKRLITTVPPRPSQIHRLLGCPARLSSRTRSDQSHHMRELFQRTCRQTRE
jgi:hypothetical protein